MNERTRRNFFTDAAAASALLLNACNRPTSRDSDAPGAAGSGPADVTLRIGTVLADIAKEHTISRAAMVARMLELSAGDDRLRPEDSIKTRPAVVRSA